MPKNHEYYLQRCVEVHNGYYSYPSDQIFSKASDKIRILCPDHGEFDYLTLNEHLNKGRGCKHRSHKKGAITTKSWIELALSVEKHKGKYDYKDTVYDGAFVKVSIYCKKCKKSFDILPGVHVREPFQGCRTCGYENRDIPHKRTTETFIEKALAREKDPCEGVYDFSKTVYIDNNTYVTYECSKHGIQVQRPKQHLKTGCQICRGRGVTKHTKETFVELARLRHGDLYNYDKVIYRSMAHDVIITCQKSGHGDFEQRPDNHVHNGNRCPHCFGGVAIDNSEFINRCLSKHGEKFGYPNTHYVGSHEKVKVFCKKHNEEFEQLAYMHLQSEYACPRCVGELTCSLAEKEITSFLREHYNGPITGSERTVLPYREIDIFLPELKLGIEFHGNYWHCESRTKKSAHKVKADLAEKKGIRLIQIFEHEWNNKREIVGSRLLSILGINKRIFARNTKIVSLRSDDKNIFLEKNHIQGMDNSSVHLGLTYENELVAVMTFGKSRFNQNYDFELIRYASVLGTNIVGGAGKLLSAFREDHEGSIISYADRRWSTGDLYRALGFSEIEKTKSGYFYYHINKKTVHNRMNFQKKKLTNMPFYDDILTECEIMKLNGYERIWDAGDSRWVLERA